MLRISPARILPLLGLLASAVSLDAGAIPLITLIDSSTQGIGNDAHVYAGNYNGTTPVGASWSSNPLVVPPPGNFSGVYQSPFNNTPLLDTQSYFSVGAENGVNGGPSPTSLTFGSVQNAFALLWGSIDDYNTLQFFQGSSQIFSMTGADVISRFNLGGSAPNFEKVALLSFAFTGNETFNSVRFISTQAAFEFALPVRSVPEPGTLGLIGVGLIGFRLLRSRRRPS